MHPAAGWRVSGSRSYRYSKYSLYTCGEGRPKLYLKRSGTAKIQVSLSSPSYINPT